MLDLTRTYKNKMSSLDTVEERLSLLKDKYADKTACIVAPGPSLKEHDSDKLKSALQRDDIVVLSMKQAYDWTKENTDFHILNTWNFDKVNGYDYTDPDTIVFFGLTKAYIEAQMEKIMIKPSVCDMWIPISTPPYHQAHESIQSTRNFDLFFQLGSELEMRWGRSIIYEQAIPLALYMGCKNIITIGWDIGDPSLGKKQGHAYSYDKMKPIDSDPADIQEAIDSTKELYEWFNKHNINFRILSNTNPADKRFERIPNLESI